MIDAEEHLRRNSLVYLQRRAGPGADALPVTVDAVAIRRRVEVDDLIGRPNEARQRGRTTPRGLRRQPNFKAVAIFVSGLAELYLFDLSRESDSKFVGAMLVADLRAIAMYVAPVVGDLRRSAPLFAPKEVRAAGNPARASDPTDDVRLRGQVLGVLI